MSRKWKVVYIAVWVMALTSALIVGGRFAEDYRKVKTEVECLGCVVVEQEGKITGLEQQLEEIRQVTKQKG